MSALRMRHDVGHAVSVSDSGGGELFTYVYAPTVDQLESPKPYLHPVRTRSGLLVSLFRPHDHVWHTGLSWTLPVVGDENFWGGPSFERGRGYVQRTNNGAQMHRTVTVADVDAAGTARFVHDLEWISQPGELLFTERRALSARLSVAGEWLLLFDVEMTNRSGHDIALGSPATRGRSDAGYGGLFWRGPRSFADGGVIVTPSGPAHEDAVRGRRHEWAAFSGRHDAVSATSVVAIVDARENPGHPTAWFARSSEYVGLNPAPFFHEEHLVRAGESVRFRYAVAIAEAAADGAAGAAARAGEWLEATR